MGACDSGKTACCQGRGWLPAVHGPACQCPCGAVWCGVCHAEPLSNAGCHSRGTAVQHRVPLCVTHANLASPRPGRDDSCTACTAARPGQSPHMLDYTPTHATVGGQRPSAVEASPPVSTSGPYVHAADGATDQPTNRPNTARCAVLHCAVPCRALPCCAVASESSLLRTGCPSASLWPSRWRWRGPPPAGPSCTSRSWATCTLCRWVDGRLGRWGYRWATVMGNVHVVGGLGLSGLGWVVGWAHNVSLRARWLGASGYEGCVWWPSVAGSACGHPPAAAAGAAHRGRAV